MERREFIARFGSIAATFLLGGRAEASETPVVGILGFSSPGETLRLPAIRKGLKEGGYFEGRNLAIDNRSAFGHSDELPQIVSDFVRHPVAVIITTGGNAPALVAKAGAKKVPVVFTIGGDPVQLGLVNSVSRPGGNMTGFSLDTVELIAKQLEMLHGMVPQVASVALLLGSGDTDASRLSKQNAEMAAKALGLKLFASYARSIEEFEAALASAVQQGAGALVVAAEPSFMHQRAQVIDLAHRYRLPAIYPWREFVENGGLMSYGPEIADQYRQAGSYAARILDGAAPGDLPVQFPTRFELIINRKTADSLGLTISRLLSAWANHVIE
jgi:putative ABC transport system substrate-binding protein